MSSVNVESLLNESRMARAYIDITQKMGPSEQLLSFINHDGQLGSELGLESFDSFSLQTRHEIFLSKLNPDALEWTALENLKGVVGDIKAIASKINTQVMLGGITAAVILSSKLIYNHFNGRCFTYHDFESFKKDFSSHFEKDKEFIRHIPHTLREKEWYEFDKFDDHYTSFRFSEHKNKFSKNNVKFEDSGWTPVNFKEAVKWLEECRREFEDEGKDIIDLIDIFEHIVNLHEFHEEMVGKTTVDNDNEYENV